jgi:hypothetical protein
LNADAIAPTVATNKPITDTLKSVTNIMLNASSALYGSFIFIIIIIVNGAGDPVPPESLR